MDVSKIEKENNLHFRWTKHLFVLANILIILSLAISWIVHHKLATDDTSLQDPNNFYIPFMVMTPCAILAWGMSFYFNNKDMALIKNNVPKKYVTLFYISNIVFFVFIFACTVLFTVLVIILFQQRALIDETTAFAITFAVSAVFSIIAISLNRYALYAMEFEIYKKRYGEIAKDKKNETK